MDAMNTANSDDALPPEVLSDEALAWIVRLHSGEATELDWEQYRLWRAQSSMHLVAATEAEDLWGIAGNIHKDPASGRIRPGRQVLRVNRRQALGALAGVTLIGVSAPSIKRSARGIWSDEVTRVAQMRDFTLPDGSLVSLNALSALDLNYEETRREILLKEGQIFFRVAQRSSDPPVFIRGKQMVIETTGGGVDLNQNLPGELVAVSAIERSVLVRHAETSQVRVVQPGERTVFAPHGAPVTSNPQGAMAALAWRDGRLVAEETPLAEVIAGLRPWYPGWITLLDEAVSGLRTNAVLDLREPEGSLDALEQGLPIHVRRAGTLLTVITAA